MIIVCRCCCCSPRPAPTMDDFECSCVHGWAVIAVPSGGNVVKKWRGWRTSSNVFECPDPRSTQTQLVVRQESTWSFGRFRSMHPVMLCWHLQSRYRHGNWKRHDSPARSYPSKFVTVMLLLLQWWYIPVTYAVRDAIGCTTCLVCFLSGVRV